jgi:hypothetical protein
MERLGVLSIPIMTEIQMLPFAFNRSQTVECHRIPAATT